MNTDGQHDEGAANGEVTINGTAADHEMLDVKSGVQSSQQNGEQAVGAGLRGEKQPNKVRVTTPYLTKYERARVLGTRALQIRYVLLYPDLTHPINVLS